MDLDPTDTLSPPNWPLTIYDLPELAPLFGLDFYKSYRAYVRAKVASFRLDDPNLSSEEKTSTLGEARAYYRLSHSTPPG